MSSNVSALITQAAQDNGVDPDLALAVAQQESNFNQNAVSSAGAIGVMQVMPGTAAQYGADPYDTADNIQAGVSYLGDLLNNFGDETTALAAYNWGPGNVQKAINTYGTAPVTLPNGTTGPAWLAAAPAETQNYVARVMGNAGYSLAAAAPVPSPSISAASVFPLPSSMNSNSAWMLAAAAGAVALLLWSNR